MVQVPPIMSGSAMARVSAAGGRAMVQVPLAMTSPAIVNVFPAMTSRAMVKVPAAVGSPAAVKVSRP
ncbi:hypothetical protein RKD27_004131 [Streptomyces sp. SAI-126]|uniref:hypothetical protein n=1 Tax=Streptomyces sp. SAI-126 TaxID=3377732 RepID=UPI003C79FCAD